jgi:iron-sulfur cluster assembly accessory protein
MFLRLTALIAEFKFVWKNMQSTSANEPVVQLTPNAAEEVRSLMQKPENAGKTLRVYVEQGGCSGMQYSMTFDEKRADDATVEAHGVPVVVDPFSAQYLRGAVVDFSDSLTAGGFKITNPNAKQSCGCGKSFTA